MNIKQISNIFYYTGIMLLDNKIITTSPDYLIEKSLKFFGKLGKPEFIEFPKISFDIQKSEITDNCDFWKKYCEIWHTKSDDYELMNIINFLLNVFPIYVVNSKKSLTFKQFEKYIGDLNSISEYDLSGLAHFKILEFINKHTDFDNRHFKLIYLKSIE